MQARVVHEKTKLDTVLQREGLAAMSALFLAWGRGVEAVYLVLHAAMQHLLPCTALACMFVHLIVVAFLKRTT